MLSPQQLADRATGIGGSDAGAALGISKWKTPFALWKEKRDGITESAAIDSEAARWGTLLEAPVAEEFSRVSGLRVQRVNRTLRSPAFPFMVANIDRAIVNPALAKRVVWTGHRLTTDAILEVKTSGFLDPEQWGEEGTDEVPAVYLAQATHYIIVTGVELVHLAALFNGRTFRRYAIRRDPELVEMVIEGEREFWRRVLENDPPEPVSAKDVLMRFPRSKELEIEATPEIADALEKLSRAKAAIAELDAEIEALEVKVKAYMGEASALTVRGIIAATWRSAKDGTRFDADAFKVAHPDLFAKFQAARAGARRFLLKEPHHDA